MKKKLFLLLISMAVLFEGIAQPANGQVERVYTLFFKVNQSNIDQNYKDNAATIEALVRDVNATLENQGTLPQQIHIVASASPEGPATVNRRLSLERARNARRLIMKLFPQYSPGNITVTSSTNDWSGLEHILVRSTNVKYKDPILKILRDPNIQNKDAAIRRIPKAFQEIRYDLMDNLRTAAITIKVVRKYSYGDDTVKRDPVIQPLNWAQKTLPTANIATKETPAKTIEVPQVEPIETLPPYYFALKTNTLYDLAAVPNIGVEVYLGKQWTAAANWMYAWWKTDKKHWYWRIYGGDIAIRKWLGTQALLRPFQGHHVGVYGQMVTYDFETGKRGYIGDRFSFGGGVEYGYSHPIGKRLNLDFTIGAGYLGGQVREYLPIDGHYVWQKTKKSHWFGPTKLEVQLVWLLGRGNVNYGKGGNQ